MGDDKNQRTEELENERQAELSSAAAEQGPTQQPEVEGEVAPEGEGTEPSDSTVDAEIEVADAEAASSENEDQEEDDGDAGKKGGRWPVDRLMPLVEALVFASGDPLPIRRMCDVIQGATRAEVKAALEALGKEYARRGFRVVEVSGGWQIRTAPEYHAYVKQLFKERPFRLTRAAVESLAIVAYKQPATRAEVEAVRGVDSSGVLESLVERRLVRVAGRRDVPGRPLVYTTTPVFLETFGLKDLKSLPTLAEIGDELAGLAEQAEFDSGTESDAPIIPLEDAEGAGESEGPQDEKQSGEQTNPEQSDAQAGQESDRESKDGVEADSAGEAGEQNDDEIPKVRFDKRQAVAHEDSGPEDSEPEDRGSDDDSQEGEYGNQDRGGE